VLCSENLSSRSANVQDDPTDSPLSASYFFTFLIFQGKVATADKFSTCLAFVLTESLKLSIGTKIGDLEWPWTTKWPIFCVILLNLVVSGAHCVKVVDKANLRLLCLVVNAGMLNKVRCVKAKDSKPRSRPRPRPETCTAKAEANATDPRPRPRMQKYFSSKCQSQSSLSISSHFRCSL